ncbi:MAG TPA: DUF397 domain-containing protein [Pseudonocardiaceae bacterium]|nr:DUF397 domain-containing protein [Pseudonocardiaceae bacterium]
MRSSDLSRAAWRKSSRSNGGVDGNCVEVAEVPDHVVLRDSKDPDGPVLALPWQQWRAFLSGVRTGQFD